LRFFPPHPLPLPQGERELHFISSPTRGEGISLFYV